MRFSTRRLFLLGAALAALAMLMMAPLAGADDDDGGGGDLARGTGVSFGGVVNFDFLATSGPQGQNPTGTYFFENTQINASFSGNVTCLVVSGNTATIGGVITQTNFPGQQVGDRRKFTVQDNGPNGFLDVISGTGGQTGPLDCAPRAAANTLQSGDIVVQDNTAGGGGDDDDDEDEDDDEDDD